MEFYLQGQGSRNDAVFREINSRADQMRVVVERGLSNCVDETMDIALARELYQTLASEGWHRVPKSRRSLEQIARDIRD